MQTKCCEIGGIKRPDDAKNTAFFAQFIVVKRIGVYLV
jgi:hypothetical protein